MKAKRILAIEDEKDILDMYEYLFDEAGYEVSTSLTGANILTRINEFHPDLIMLDINLGELNGLDISRTIKDNPQTNPIPVMLISGEQQTRSLMEYSKANAFVAKPFDIDNLMACIADTLN